MTSQHDTAYNLLQWYADIGVNEAIESVAVNKMLGDTSAIDALAVDTQPVPDAVSTNAAYPTPSRPRINETDMTAVSSRNHAASSARAPLPEHDAVHLAQQAASACDTLDALYQAIRNFDGCPLKKTAINTVIYDGVADARIMVIGEAPGADEDRRGIPFCGASGKLLDKVFASVGLSRAENLYITNTVFWRPPGNRKPSTEEIAICRPFVQRHIALMKPDIMLLVGGVSTQGILGSKTGITKLRGTIQHYHHESSGRDIPCLPLLHPAYLLRQPGQKAAMWHDMLILREYLA